MRFCCEKHSFFCTWSYITQWM